MELFEKLGLQPDALSAIEKLGFTHPTPIQQLVIPAVLEDKNDIIGLAQTGTGKTAAYGLPIVQMMEPATKNIQALILCPTRELCVQITGDMNTFVRRGNQTRVVAVYGGANITLQIRALREGCSVVVGTPGRVKDLILRKVLRIEQVRWLVLDEADEMLNMGFLDDIDEILSYTPVQKRTMLFSATMPPEIQKIARKYMHEAIELTVGKRNEGAENVTHKYYLVSARERFEALQRIADINPRIYGIIFCRTRAETKDVADKLISNGYNADALHGDLSQSQRDHVMHRFRTKNLQMLVATDVAARGLDVNDLTHVINYNLPDDPEIYVHRSGRTGRAGKSGVAISLVSSREERRVRDIERMTGRKFINEKIPSGIEICEKQLYSLVDKVEKIEVNEAQIERFLPVVYKKLEWLTREDLIKHFISVEFNRFLTYYKNSGDINVSNSSREEKGRDKRKDRDGDRDRKPGRDKRSDSSGERDGGRRNDGERMPFKKPEGQSGDFVNYKLNIGKKQELTPAALIGLINDATKTRNIRVGRIKIMHSVAFFEVDRQYAGLMEKAFRKQEFDGIHLNLKEDAGMQEKPQGNRFDRKKSNRK